MLHIDDTNQALVEVKNVSKHFALPSHMLQRLKPTLQALRNVSLSIQKNESFCLVGESGCGKTTLGRIIMGLLPLSSGQILYNGKRIDYLSKNKRRAYYYKMQMVFQNPYASLNPRMTVAQTLAESLKVLEQKQSKAKIQQKVQSVMNSVGADETWGKRMPHALSGGQRQRISIARALMTDPEFIVADEPVAALDVSVQAQVLNLLRHAKQKHNLTYIFITHDLSVVENFGDRVAVMYLGKIVEIASVPMLFKDPRHPYTQLLLQSVPELSYRKTFTKKRIAGEPPNPINPPSGCAFRTRCPYAKEKCATSEPTLQEYQTEHRVACHFLHDIPTYQKRSNP